MVAFNHGAKTASMIRDTLNKANVPHSDSSADFNTYRVQGRGFHVTSMEFLSSSLKMGVAFFYNLLARDGQRCNYIKPDIEKPFEVEPYS